MDMILELENVSKAFGSRKVIGGLSFSVPEHAVYGFIGKNGSGKTTTMKMILGLLKADSGSIHVNGEAVRYGENRTNRYIGYLPDVPEFYHYMTPYEYLVFCGEITGIPEGEVRKRAGEMLELTGLSREKKRIRGFSRGMKQRLGIAQALLNAPKLLICDEPTSALDPVGRKDILDVLLAVKEKTTVVFSTHILADVERICDEIGLLHGGKLALSGTIDEIRQMHGSEGYEIDFIRPEEAAQFLAMCRGGVRVGKRQIYVKDGTREEMTHAMGLLAQADICPRRIEMCEPTLESLFMEVVGE